MTPEPKSAPVVKQADRDAAIAWDRQNYGPDCDYVQQQIADDDALVQAFARHRTATEAASKQWRDAVDDELTNWMATSDSFLDARTAVRWLIEREQEAALDPAISERARDLVATSAAEVAELREALADIAEDRMPMYRPDGSRWWADGGEGFMEWAKQHAATAIASGQYRKKGSD